MYLCKWGRGSIRLTFFFKWGGELRGIQIRCQNRSEAARQLWRYRLARKWWLSCNVPYSVVGGSMVTRYGLRWIAVRENQLCYRTRQDKVRLIKFKPARLRESYI